VEEVEHHGTELDRGQRRRRHQHRLERSHQLLAADRKCDAAEAERQKGAHADPDRYVLHVGRAAAPDQRQRRLIEAATDEVEGERHRRQGEQIADERHAVAPGHEHVPSEEGADLRDLSQGSIAGPGRDREDAHRPPATATNASSSAERSGWHERICTPSSASRTRASPRTARSPRARTNSSAAVSTEPSEPIARSRTGTRSSPSRPPLRSRRRYRVESARATSSETVPLKVTRPPASTVARWPKPPISSIRCVAQTTA